MSDYDPDFDAILRTDRFVEALAGGARMSPVDPLSAMLGGWRDGVRSQPDSHVVTFEQAASALYATAKPLRRSRIGLAVVGGAAAAVLALGGFGAVVYDAQPGDALYGLRSSLFGDVKAVRDDQVTLAAQTELAQVQQLVQQGKWDEAQQKLVKLGPAVKSVDNPQNQQQLVNQYNALAVKVIEKNPEATVPPAGQSAPVQPSSPLTLLPPPSVAADTPTTPTPPDTNMLLSPSPTGPLPTPTGPLPTPTGPPPTPTGPLPTATGPLPTATGPLPTGPLPTAPLPTPTAAPLPTAPAGPLPTAPLPTPTAAPLPTAPAGPLPTPTAAPLPTPTAAPLPTPTAAPLPRPTPEAPKPTPEAPKPTPQAPPPTPQAPPPTPEAPKPTPAAPIPTPAAAPQPVPVGPAPVKINPALVPTPSEAP